MKNYYEILEVNENASKEIIEKAYKVLIKKYHPDLYMGEKRKIAEEKVRDINEAYKILSDSFLREQYDHEFQKEQIEYYIEKRSNYKKKSNTTNKKKIQNKTVNENKYQVGKIGNEIEILKEVFKKKPKKLDLKNLKREDWISISLTIVIMIILCVILWFIPFTNSFIRSFTVDNPLFSWIWK